MPEIPDLEIIKESLNHRAAGLKIEAARQLRPGVLRPLAATDFAEDIAGRTFGTTNRQGKMLLIDIEPDRLLAVHFMLTGAFRYCAHEERLAKRTYFVLGFSEFELRYIDDRQTGMVYYARPDQLAEIARLDGNAPDALDDFAPDEFVSLLKPFRGEIKGILTRGQFLAGIGNAYADDILFEAGIAPFKKRTALSKDEVERLRVAIPRVLHDAIDTLRARGLPNIDREVRDFLKVHRKGGQPCPRCGHTISEMTANQRVTSWCRQCQPGSLIRN